MAEALFGDAVSVALRPRWILEHNRGYIRYDLEGRDVFVRRRALRRMCATSQEHEVEVAFLCMGRRAVDSRGPYVVVDALPLVGVGARAHVELPIARKLAAQRRHAALDVVGWAHTHPGFGVFFSSTDIENCKQYGPDAVNFVFDPIADRLGIAAGDRMVLEVTPMEESVPRRAATRSRPATAELLRVVPRRQPIEGARRRPMMSLLVCLLFLATAFGALGAFGGAELP